MDTVTWDQKLYLGEQIEGRRVGYIYAILDPLGIVCYIGSTTTTADARMAKHRVTMKAYARNNLEASSPLTRAVVAMGWNPDEMSIRVYRTVYWSGASPDTLRREEAAAIKLFRALGCELRQRNVAFCETERKRNQMARWRAEHPGYMAAAAKAWRARRKRQALEQQQAQTAED